MATSDARKASKVQLTRKVCSITNAAVIADVSRRTIYNWLERGLLDYTFTANGQRRIFVDSLFRDAQTTPKGPRRSAA